MYQSSRPKLQKEKNENVRNVSLNNKIKNFRSAYLRIPLKTLPEAWKRKRKRTLETFRLQKKKKKKKNKKIKK